MFYEECILDGILCFRNHPDGDWRKKTKKELTAMLLEARRGSFYQPAISSPSGTPADQFNPPYTVTC